MIKDFTPRLYQETIFASASRKNTLVVLPTGMGKTNIFLMLAAHRLKLFPDSKILLIGPTRPLIEQYLNVFKKYFEIEESKLAVFTGKVPPKKREELWKTAKVIFSTPQGLENDIITRRINLEEVSLLGVDEAHRAVGNYAYVFVAQQYAKIAKFPRIIAMTASPGSDMEKIQEICRNLSIENIEVRTENDPDVKQYIQEVDLNWVEVNLTPPFIEIKNSLQLFLKDRTKKLKSWGIIKRKDSYFVSKKDLLVLQSQIRAQISSGEKDFVLWNAISVLAEIMKIHHALELIETQGIPAVYKYLKNLNEESYSTKTKAIKNIVSDINFKTALFKAEKAYKENIEHPKLIELQKIVEKEVQKPDVKILIFNNFRENALDIKEKLNKIKGVKAELFVGQQKKGETGLSQKQQKEIIEKFSNNFFNVLVCTSIGEEGLDIPAVDLVIFFEPIPSEIRHIQRRGRTGRLEQGRVIILMTKNTMDVGFRWAAYHKESRMNRNLKELKQKLILQKPGLYSYEKKEVKMEKLKIFADFREKSNPVVKELANMNIDLKLEKVENADYLLSSRCGVEFKTVNDFVDSIVDGRLLQQLKVLKESFERPLVIIEGIEDIYSVRNVHPNAIRGMIATITVSYGIPLVYTKSPQETAALLCIIAKREQEVTEKDFQLHSEKRIFTLKEAQEYLVSALPGIGSALAKPLLKHFKSVRKIFNAKEEELQEVEKIGKEKAKKIRDVIDKEWEE